MQFRGEGGNVVRRCRRSWSREYAVGRLAHDDREARRRVQQEQDAEQESLYGHRAVLGMTGLANGQESIDGTPALPEGTTPLGCIMSCRSKASLRTRRS